MTNDTRHLDEELSELADDRLHGQARVEADAHLAVCALCRARLADLRRLTASLAAPAPEVPPELRARIGRALDDEDRRGRARAGSARRWLLAASVLLAVGAAVYFAARQLRVPDVDAVAADYLEVRSRWRPLDVITEKPQELEAFFTRRGLPFPARVFDFGMMNYQLAGGRLHSQAGRPAALYAYHSRGGPAGDVLVCQMFPGSVGELGPAPEIRRNDGIDFHRYRVGSVTLVFWQEGDIVCVLAGDGDPEAILQFAFAKAVKV